MVGSGSHWWCLSCTVDERELIFPSAGNTEYNPATTIAAIATFTQDGGFVPDKLAARTHCLAAAGQAGQGFTISSIECLLVHFLCHDF